MRSTVTDERAYWSAPRCWVHDCRQRRAGEMWCKRHEDSHPADVERATAWLVSMGGKVGEEG